VIHFPSVVCTSSPNTTKAYGGHSLLKGYGDGCFATAMGTSCIVNGRRGSDDAASGNLAVLFETNQVMTAAVCPACGYPTVRPDLCAACRPELVAE
jgi:hypothetical protein